MKLEAITRAKIWLLATVVIGFSFLNGCDGNWADAGVKLANEIPAYALEQIKSHKILDENEKLIAYYDVSLPVDGSEATILTNERVVYLKDDRSTSIKYDRIIDIKYTDEGWAGDTIVIKSSEGEWMKIVIAVANDGALLFDILKDSTRL